MYVPQQINCFEALNVVQSFVICFRNGSSSVSNGHAATSNGSSSSYWKMSRVFADNDESLINRKLPKELLLKIFSWLDIVSLCRCAQVSLFDHSVSTVSIHIQTLLYSYNLKVNGGNFLRVFTLYIYAVCTYILLSYQKATRIYLIYNANKVVGHT